MPETITPSQCRAARALVGFSQKHLAEAASVGQSTVANFENEVSVPYAKNMADIIRALEAAGVEFIPENGGGAGLRHAKPKRGRK